MTSPDTRRRVEVSGHGGQARPSASFADRHIGPDQPGLAAILARLGQPDLDAVEKAVVPEAIRSNAALTLPEPASEVAALAELRAFAARNRPMVQMIGLGYHDTITPGVIQRNVLENPAWYTAYTPYQPEISQGRLEALLNFQTAVADLTGLDIANASMLDEGTAAAEAMTLIRRTAKSKSNRFVVDADTLPQTLAVLRTRAEPIGIEIVVADLAESGEAGSGEVPARDVALPAGDCFGVLLSYPGASGAVRDLSAAIAAAHEREAKVALATDLLALTLLRAPGEIGADVAVGSAQRFGVPLGFGGPHAGFHRGARRAAAPAARPARRGLPRRARHHRLPARPADPRATHSPGEGDVQHLHGAGAARRDGVDVCGVPRARRAAPDRRTGARRGRRARRRRCGRRGSDRARARSSTPSRVSVPGRAADIVAAARDRGINLWADGADAVQISVSEATTGGDLDDVLDAFGADGAAATPRVDLPAALVADVGLPDAPGVPRAPQRDRHAALPAPALGHGPRARPHDDPARLLHDEAERDRRDGGRHLAGVRRAAPVRARRGRRRACSS